MCRVAAEPVTAQMVQLPIMLTVQVNVDGPVWQKPSAFPVLSKRNIAVTSRRLCTSPQPTVARRVDARKDLVVLLLRDNVIAFVSLHPKPHQANHSHEHKGVVARSLLSGLPLSYKTSMGSRYRQPRKDPLHTKNEKPPKIDDEHQ